MAAGNEEAPALGEAGAHVSPKVAALSASSSLTRLRAQLLAARFALPLELAATVAALERADELGLPVLDLAPEAES